MGIGTDIIIMFITFTIIGGTIGFILAMIIACVVVCIGNSRGIKEELVNIRRKLK